jgi:hypothetical protein
MQDQTSEPDSYTSFFHALRNDPLVHRILRSADGSFEDCILALCNDRKRLLKRIEELENSKPWQHPRVDNHKNSPTRPGDTVERFARYEAFCAMDPCPTGDAYHAWYARLMTWMNESEDLLSRISSRKVSQGLPERNPLEAQPKGNR